MFKISLPPNDAQRFIINGDEANDDVSEISKFESVNATIFSCDVTFGVNEANRSTVETRVHNLLVLFDVSMAVDVDFFSMPSMMSMSLILLLCRNAGRLFGQFGTLSTGV